MVPRSWCSLYSRPLLVLVLHFSICPTYLQRNFTLDIHVHLALQWSWKQSVDELTTSEKIPLSISLTQMNVVCAWVFPMSVSYHCIKMHFLPQLSTDVSCNLMWAHRIYSIEQLSPLFIRLLQYFSSFAQSLLGSQHCFAWWVLHISSCCWVIQRILFDSLE